MVENSLVQTTIWSIYTLLIIGLPLAGIAKTFSKAGENWWAALVPFYNLYMMTKIARISPVWILIFFIPYLNIIAILKTTIAISRAFDKGLLYGIFIGLIPWIGWPLLGFGNAEYRPGKKKKESPRYDLVLAWPKNKGNSESLI